MTEANYSNDNSMWSGLPVNSENQRQKVKHKMNQLHHNLFKCSSKVSISSTLIVGIIVSIVLYEITTSMLAVNLKVILLVALSIFYLLFCMLMYGGARMIWKDEKLNEGEKYDPGYLLVFTQPMIFVLLGVGNGMI